MPRIIPISDLRKKTPEVLELCQEGEPVFVTRNGEGELVVMSQALYEQMAAKLDLCQKLEEAEIEHHSGAKRKSHSVVLKGLRSRLF